MGSQHQLVSIFTYTDKWGDVFFGAKVGDLVVGNGNTDREMAEYDAKLFLEEPMEWLRDSTACIDNIDEEPSLRPAVENVKQRLRHLAKTSSGQLKKTEEFITDWESRQQMNAPI